jgi:two-component system, chemotaxis family, chemotaxis protein CheY
LSFDIPGKWKTVLLVEDDPTLRELMARLLEPGGYAVLEAGDGVDALEILRSQPVDALVTDYLMPRMNGYDLLREIKAERPRLPAIMTTCEAPDAVILDLLQLSRIVVLIKPFDACALEDALERVLSDDVISRASIRVRLRIPCRVGAPDGQLEEATIRDVSFSGAQLELARGAAATARFELGAVLRLSFQGLDRLAIRARVRRVYSADDSRPPFVGVSFEDHGSESELILKKFVLNKLKDQGIGIS